MHTEAVLVACDGLTMLLRALIMRLSICKLSCENCLQFIVRFVTFKSSCHANHYIFFFKLVLDGVIKKSTWK